MPHRALSHATSDMRTEATGVTRRRVLGWSAGGGAALAATAVGANRRLASATNDATLTVEVAPDISTFSAIREAAEGDALPTGPFYVEGPIYPEETLNDDGTAPDDAESLGTWRCWGWNFDGSEGVLGPVGQSYELDGRGDFQTQGLEGTETRALTGGTGEFSGLRGEGHITHISPDSSSFRITIELGD